MPPLEAWEKVFVESEAYAEDVHATLLCVECHAGSSGEDKTMAHDGLIPDPSENPETSCGSCHPELVGSQQESLHFTLQGYETSLMVRADPERWEAVETMMDNHCTKCHVTCGQCHISQPASVGGGLLDGHSFRATPPMSRTCTACHGSRIGNEYLGKNEDLMGDVHFRQGRMACVDCHGSTEMHGEINGGAIHRYDGEQSPRCENCHPNVVTREGEIVQHSIHADLLSCQVCHSITYKNCDGCHTRLGESGIPYFETDGSYLTFLIGLNPLQSETRPYRYVPLRHVPIAIDSFADYGESLLPNFSAAPTWRYTTPHNIQRDTPQNATCDACHGSDQFFLTVDKVYPEELEANEEVIVTMPPPPIDETR